MLESLDSIFRRILTSRGYDNYPADDEIFEELIQELSDAAEARCELIRIEGHDKGWADCEDFHDIRPDS